MVCAGSAKTSVEGTIVVRMRSTLKGRIIEVVFRKIARAVESAQSLRLYKLVESLNSRGDFETFDAYYVTSSF
jgi:hypothetical protein